MRFKVLPPSEGALRTLREVDVQWIKEDEWIAISHEAGAVGDFMVLDLGIGELPLRYPVRVIDSRPVMVEDSVRHQLHLKVDYQVAGAR